MGVGFRVHGLGFRVHGFRVWGFGVMGLEFLGVYAFGPFRASPGVSGLSLSSGLGMLSAGLGFRRSRMNC